MKEAVTFNGIVKGDGQEATCKIKAFRVTLPGSGGLSETTQWSVVGVSKKLPDGKYQIIAEGKTERVRLVDGQWLSDGFSL